MGVRDLVVQLHVDGDQPEHAHLDGEGVLHLVHQGVQVRH